MNRRFLRQVPHEPLKLFVVLEQVGPGQKKLIDLDLERVKRDLPNVQRLLNANGYNLEVDGRPGRLFRQAVADFIKKNPQVVRGIIKSWYDALDLIAKEPAESNKVMGADVKQSGEQFGNSAKYLRWQDKAANQKFFAGELQALMRDASKILLEAGVIRQLPTDFSAMYDASFVK